MLMGDMVRIMASHRTWVGVYRFVMGMFLFWIKPFNQNTVMKAKKGSVPKLSSSLNTLLLFPMLLPTSHDLYEPYVKERRPVRQ